jgi:hypothetical protein
MATGQDQGGGVFALPDVPSLGLATWADMTSMQPGHPLVGGEAGQPGYGGGQRQVMIASGSQQNTQTLGSPARSHWSELFNLGGNPIGWVLIAVVLFWGLQHIHVRAGAGFRARS